MRKHYGFRARLRIALIIWTGNLRKCNRDYWGGWVKWRTAWAAAEPWGKKHDPDA